MTANTPRHRRELARRVSGDTQVALYWCADSNTTSIEVWQAGADEALVFVVARDRALDAFYHPFAHLPATIPDSIPC